MKDAPGVTVRDLVRGSQDRDAFRAINEDWIRRDFVIEPKDVEILSDPEGKILGAGGCVLLAEYEGRIAGCVALIPMADGGLELGKMGVLPEFQGRRIGHALMAACVARARERAVNRLYLETNSKLAPALHLYRSFGFELLPPGEAPPGRYSRADTHMELRF